MTANARGYTLIELVAVIVAGAAIAALSLSFLARSVDTYALAAADQRLGAEAWAAVERMTREAQNATAVTLPLAGASGGTLALTDNAKSSCASCADRSTSITYALSGTNLVRSGDLSGPHVIAANVSAFAVSRSAAGLVAVQLTLADGGASVSRSGSAMPFVALNPAYRVTEAAQ